MIRRCHRGTVDEYGARDKMIRSVVRIRDELTLDVQSDQVVVIVETVGNDIRLGTAFI